MSLLRLTFKMQCNFCNENYLEDESDTNRQSHLAVLIIFGAKRYAICPVCLKEVSGRKFNRASWWSKVDKWIEQYNLKRRAVQ